MTDDSILPDTDDAEREKLFAEEYVRTGDAIMACVRAGIRDPEYPMEVVARRTLERPAVKQFISLVERLNGGDAGMQPTRESISAEMDEVYRKCYAMGDLRSCIAAKRFQAELLGLLEQKLTITHNMPVAEMTTEQLERLAARKLKIIEGTAVDVTGQRMLESK